MHVKGCGDLKSDTWGMCALLVVRGGSWNACLIVRNFRPRVRDPF